MPKKHKRPFSKPPSAGAHPSLTLSNPRVPDGKHGSDEKQNESVNEALRNLRLEDAKTTTPVLPPTTANASLRWLQTIEAGQLGPPPRLPGSASRRRVPGPATPPSWETSQSHRTSEPAYMRGEEKSRGKNTAVTFPPGNLLPGGRSIHKRSLSHMVLKSMVRRWDWHLVYDHEYLSQIPIPLKEILLSYLVRSAPDEILASSSKSLRLLFPDAYRSYFVDESSQISMDNFKEEVIRLDLGRAIGTWLTGSSSLKRELLAPVKETEASGNEFLLKNGLEDPERAVPESWEDGTSPGRQHGRSSNCFLYPLSKFTPRFSNLLHLSLALGATQRASENSSIASWPSLLKITRCLSTLQSLSLAFWPCPALTPRAAAASISFKHPYSAGLSLMYGGTGFYTEHDGDWREAAGILKRLSGDLYCLQWLDLTGCGEWFEALSWTGLASTDESLGAGTSPLRIGLDWNGSWRNVHYLGLGVGWAPAMLDIGQQRPKPGMPYEDRHLPHHGTERRRDVQGYLSRDIEILSMSSVGRGLVRQDWDVEEERKKYWTEQDIRTALATQERARQVAKHIRANREQAKGRWMVIGGLKDGR